MNPLTWQKMNRLSNATLRARRPDKGWILERRIGNDIPWPVTTRYKASFRPICLVRTFSRDNSANYAEFSARLSDIRWCILQQSSIVCGPVMPQH